MRKVKNVVNNYSPAEVKVREATSNDPWGAPGTLLADLAKSTHNFEQFPEIMNMIWKRLNDHGKNWRHVYKALVLLEYIVKSGSERVAKCALENIYTIQTLKDFQFIDPTGKDQGVNVREKSKQLVALLKDDERLKEEREKALKLLDKFAGGMEGRANDGDQPSHGSDSRGAPGSDFRPRSAEEEERQVQQALEMSKREAEQRRPQQQWGGQASASDNAWGAAPQQSAPKQSDPWGGTPAAATPAAAAAPKKDPFGDQPDPWGSFDAAGRSAAPAPAPARPPPPQSRVSQPLGDVWSTPAPAPAPAAAADPFGGFGAPVQAARPAPQDPFGFGGQPTAAQPIAAPRPVQAQVQPTAAPIDPWGGSSGGFGAPAAPAGGADVWGAPVAQQQQQQRPQQSRPMDPARMMAQIAVNATQIDEFSKLSQRPGGAPAPAAAPAFALAPAQPAADPYVMSSMSGALPDPFGATLPPTVPLQPQRPGQPAASAPVNSQSGLWSGTGSLVNLDALATPSKPASANPFGPSPAQQVRPVVSPAGGTANPANPFHQPSPSMNQLRTGDPLSMGMQPLQTSPMRPAVPAAASPFGVPAAAPVGYGAAPTAYQYGAQPVIGANPYGAQPMGAYGAQPPAAAYGASPFGQPAPARPPAPQQGNPFQNSGW